MQTRISHRKTPVTLLAFSIGLALHFNAQAQETPAPAAAPAATDPVTDLDRVEVVASFRASLEKALEDKRYSAEQIDAVVAEDIGKFPDLNLAESLQRIPGVAIDRDAGEGRSITVRAWSDWLRTTPWASRRQANCAATALIRARSARPRDAWDCIS